MMVYINGLGVALPKRVVSNEAFAVLSGLDAGWIEERSGVTQRYLAPSAHVARQLAATASREALSRSRFEPGELTTLIVVSTCSELHPPVITADRVLGDLGATTASVVDMTTPRTGFMDALSMAHRLVTDDDGVVLIVGAEGSLAVSRLQDRRTCYMLSDGAGALVVSAREGFARLEPPVRGHAAASADSPAGPVTASPAAASPEEPRLGLVAALERSGPGQGAGRLTAVTQELRPDVAELPGRARLFNPLATTGYLMAASVPVLLYRLLVDEEIAAGDRALLFASDGHGNWRSAVATVTELPRLDREAVRSGPADAAAEAGEERRARAPVAALSAAELEQRIVRLARGMDLEWSPLFCLTITLAVRGDHPAVGEPLEQETGAILTVNTRSRDVVLRLEDTSSYVVLLRNTSAADVEIVTRRLKILLENVDPAGELHIDVATRCFPVPGDADVPAVARDVVGHVTGR